MHLIVYFFSYSFIYFILCFGLGLGFELSFHMFVRKRHGANFRGEAYFRDFMQTVIDSDNSCLNLFFQLDQAVNQSKHYEATVQDLKSQICSLQDQLEIKDNEFAKVS